MSQITSSRPRGAFAVRAFCYVLSAIILVLLTLAGVLIVMSFGPDPGDNMVLMGVPMLGLPMVPCCLLLLCVAVVSGPYLKAAERFAFIAMGASFVLVFGALYLLG